MVGRDDDTLAGMPAALGVHEERALIAGRYQILRWLGGGGMGRVYEALDTELHERVALKVLRTGLSETALERFRREVKLTRRILHRNVARMFDIGDHAGEKFLTMELVDGASLTREVGAAMPWSRLQPLALQLCAGLAAAHAEQIIHRDLKPDNVMIERSTDRAVITDFGIAHSSEELNVTQEGSVLGTPRYMSPEQLAGDEIDARADVFSLGVMLYELASGSRPWPGEGAVAIAVAQATQPARPLRAKLPAAVIEMIEACLAIDREQRPASVETIASAFAAVGAEPTGRASRPTLTPPSTPIPALPPTNVSVLPFRCAPDDQHLGDWLTEDLADALSTTPELRVKPAGEGGRGDPRATGRELGVDHVVDGSIRRIPTGVRVAARLISVADGFQVWARRSDHTEAEILAATDFLAREIATALSTQATTRNVASTDPRAVELYLRARTELRRFWGDHARAAVALLEQAVALAPESREIAGAYALATTQAWLRDDEPELLARARRAVERARTAGSTEAHLASALLRMNEGEAEAGAADLATALARAPMSAPAHEIAGRILIEIDLVPEGLRHFETAIGLDPGRAQMISVDHGRIEALAGDWESADRRVAALRADPDPSFTQLGSMLESRIASWRGDLERTRQAGSTFAARLSSRWNLVELLDRHRRGEPFDPAWWAQTVAVLVTPHRPLRMRLVGLQRASEIALLVGELDAALGTLERAAELGLFDIVWLDRCPLLAPVHAHARGVALREIVAARAARVRSAFAA